MIGKKMLSWIAAGLLSVATIPAIGATVSHHAKPHAKTHARRVHHATIHRRAGVKTIAHKTTARRLAAHKTASKLVSHKVTKATRARAAARTHLVHAKHTATRLNATRVAIGVQSMHSGKTTLTKAPAKANAASHFLAATKKMH